MLVFVVPAGNCSGRWVVNEGNRGGAGNAELGPRREEAPLLAWRNEDLDPPPVCGFQRPWCRVDGEPPDFPGFWPRSCAGGGDQLSRGPALKIGHRLVSVPWWLAPRAFRTWGAPHRDFSGNRVWVCPQVPLRVLVGSSAAVAEGRLRGRGRSCCLRGPYLQRGSRRGRRRSGCLRGPYLRRGLVETSVVRDKGCFVLAVVAQIADRDAHSTQGFLDPGDVLLEDDRNSFPCSRVLSIDVRRG